VLLVKEHHADGSVFWTLPGGGVHAEESLVTGLHRELEEELFCRGVVREYAGSFEYAHLGRPDTVSVYRVFETVLLSEPTPNGREGIVGCRWVEPSAPPATTLPQVRYFLERVTG
jgi:8-oxo-dGTP pyrophosphatase MutT (NUDIX family)